MPQIRLWKGFENRYFFSTKSHFLSNIPRGGVKIEKLIFTLCGSFSIRELVMAILKSFSVPPFEVGGKIVMRVEF